MDYHLKLSRVKEFGFPRFPKLFKPTLKLIFNSPINIEVSKVHSLNFEEVFHSIQLKSCSEFSERTLTLGFERAESGRLIN